MPKKDKQTFEAFQAELLFSSGNGSVPRKSICSQKCAKPGTSSGSLKYPASGRCRSVHHFHPLSLSLFFSGHQSYRIKNCAFSFEYRLDFKLSSNDSLCFPWSYEVIQKQLQVIIPFSAPTCTSRAAAARSAAASEQHSTRKPFRSVKAL